MASLIIMAKTFTKIVKTFVGLSTTIVAIKRRTVLNFHLEAKKKKNKKKKKKKTTKMKFMQKTE